MKLSARLQLFRFATVGIFTGWAFGQALASNETPPTFASPTDVAAGSDLGFNLVAADLNGDGKLDLVVPNRFTGTVTVLLSNGDGTFQQPVSYQHPTGAYPYQVAVADFNGDGKPDIAVATGVNVSILLGRGDGSFSDPVDSGSRVSNVGEIVPGDFDRDGKVDLMFTDEINNLFVLLGQGDGTFRKGSHYLTGASSLAVTDLDGDGKLDIIARETNPSTGSPIGLAARYGNGDGTFTARSVLVPVIGSPSDSPATFGDFLGSGGLDVGWAQGPVSVIVNDGQRVFHNVQEVVDGTSMTTTNTFDIGSPLLLSVGDFNGDGQADFALTQTKAFGQWRLAVCPGNGDGTFQGTVPLSAARAQVPGRITAPGIDVIDDALFEFPKCIAVGDFNGDGKPDLALAYAEAGNGTAHVLVYLNTTSWPEPRLKATQQGGYVILSWPGASTGFLLESSTTLTPGNWLPVAETPARTNGLWRVEIPVSAQARDFRLRKPE